MDTTTYFLQERGTLTNATRGDLDKLDALDQNKERGEFLKPFTSHTSIIKQLSNFKGGTYLKHKQTERKLLTKCGKETV